MNKKPLLALGVVIILAIFAWLAYTQAPFSAIYPNTGNSSNTKNGSSDLPERAAEAVNSTFNSALNSNTVATSNLGDFCGTPPAQASESIKTNISLEQTSQDSLLESGLHRYKQLTGTFPAKLNDLLKYDSKTYGGLNMQNLLTDPATGKEFVYTQLGSGQNYKICLCNPAKNAQECHQSNY